MWMVYCSWMSSRRQLVFKIDELKAKKNAANDDISRLIKDKQDPKPTIASMKAIAAEIDALEPQVKVIDEQIQNILLFIPNIPHDSVPKGGMEANQIVANWGEKPVFDFKPKTHIEIAESLDIIDFKRGTKLSGSNFILYKDLGARLERAFIILCWICIPASTAIVKCRRQSWSMPLP